MSEKCTSSKTLKELFLKDNKDFEEVSINDKTKAVGKFDEIDLTEDEVWLMQCPKGLNIKELESQAMKMPGRTTFGNLESVCMEYADDTRKKAFAYNRKGKYSLRILPIRGSIIIRERLKANNPITEEQIAQCCPTTRKRVPMPKNLRIRHPLLGTEYEQAIDIDTSLIRRLRKADKHATEVLNDSLFKKKSPKSESKVSKKESKNIEMIEINGFNENDKDVEFVSETKAKKRKHKNKSHDESLTTETEFTPKKRKNQKK